MPAASESVAGAGWHPYAIFLTDRRRLGGDIRLVPAPRFLSGTTAKLHRTALFGTAREAKKYLRKLERLGRYCYTIGQL